MCEGQVKCCGAPMFLKKRFGAGYHLRIAKGVGFKPPLMNQTLQKYLPSAHIHSEIQSEVIYSLESNHSNSQNVTKVFPKLFDELESSKERLGIASCGLTITTMEDVFLRVGNEFEAAEEEVQYNRKNIKDKSAEPLFRKKTGYLTGNELMLSHLVGLLMKRFHFAKRYWPMMTFQLIVPGALFVVALLTDYAIRRSIVGETKNLNLNLQELYGNTEGFFESTDAKFAETYRSNADKYGMNTTFITTDPNEWALENAKDLENYIKHYLVGAVVSGDDSLNAQVWYNNEALHSMPISINMFYESLLKYMFPQKSSEISVSVTNHPLSYSESTLNIAAVIFGWAITCLMLIPITVPFIGASYVLFPINERTSKAKLLQLMTGLSSILFWTSNFFFDLLNHSLVVLIIYILFAIFDFNQIFFAQSNTAIGLFLMLFLFGFASIPLAYCFSLWLKKPSTGFAVLVILYLLFGIIAVSAMGTLDLMINILHFDFISSVTFNRVLGIFRMIPVFSMSFGVQKLYRMGSFTQICKENEKKNMTIICTHISKKDFLFGCCLDKCTKTNDCYHNKNPLDFDNYGVGQEFVYLVCSGILFFLILLIFEGK